MFSNSEFANNKAFSKPSGGTTAPHGRESPLRHQRGPAGRLPAGQMGCPWSTTSWIFGLKLKNALQLWRLLGKDPFSSLKNISYKKKCCLLCALYFLDVVQGVGVRKPEAAMGKKTGSLLHYSDRCRYLNFETVKKAFSPYSVLSYNMHLTIKFYFSGNMRKSQYHSVHVRLVKG